MLYRVRIDLAFDNEADGDKVYKEAEMLLSKATKITHAEGMVEVTSVELHKCYHDEDPTRRCEIIKRIEV